MGGEEVAVLPALPSVDDVFWPPLVNVAVLPLPPLEVVVDVVVVEVAVVVVTVVIIEEAVSCSFVVITPSVVTNSFNLLSVSVPTSSPIESVTPWTLFSRELSRPSTCRSNAS